MIRPRGDLASLSLGALLVLAAGISPVDAAVLTLGACTPEALRALINGAANGDVLLLPACTISVAGASGDDANVSGDFDIATSITLQGVGPDATILDGAGLDRVLDIRPGATVVVADLTVRNGVTAQNGGGIRNDGGELTLVNVVITRNTGQEGGGVFNAATDGTGRLAVLGSRITDNSASFGAGVRSRSTDLLLDASTVAGNSAGLLGGGILVDVGNTIVRDSTLADNRASFRGGGIIVSEGTLLVERSALSGNAAGESGGGLLIHDAAGRLLNTTVVYNRSGGGGGGIRLLDAPNLTIVNGTITRNSDTGNQATGAGGIAKDLGILRVRNSVIAENTVGPGTPAGNADLDLANLNENSNSFIGTSDGHPRLGPLRDNGGPTFTMAPFPGSPLIDSGNNIHATAEGLTTDQRGIGFARILDGDGTGPATVDRGAVEVAAPTEPANVAILFLSNLAPVPGDTVVLGIIIRAPGRTIVGGVALFDGFDISAPLVGCPLLAGTLVTGEQVVTCSFPAFLLPPGTHTFSLFLDLDDGTTLSDTARIGG